MADCIKISDRVQRALDDNRPVVALESTIISHGMPYPENVATANTVEQIVRDAGCVPALSIVLARKADGATTVAGTMYACKLAGIDVFATGGIGGAHRNSDKTMDISADLDELQMSSVLVVCAGAKSILDIGLTLECLETRGVPVIGYRCDEMPAFYSRESGYKVDYRLESAAEIASAYVAQRQLRLQCGMLVVNPIPVEYAMDGKYIDGNISRALAEADRLGVSGKDITPFLLDKIQKLTGGKSLAANIQLVYNNARLACAVAKEICALRKMNASK